MMLQSERLERSPPELSRNRPEKGTRLTGHFVSRDGQFVHHTSTVGKDLFLTTLYGLLANQLMSPIRVPISSTTTMVIICSLGHD